MRSKYKAVKVTTEDGLVFDSKKEYRRYLELKDQEEAGIIKCLRRQVPFELLPKQLLPTPEKHGKVTRRYEPRVVYCADFVYTLSDTDETVVEDVKGFKTPVYNLKKRMFLYFYNKQIREV